MLVLVLVQLLHTRFLGHEPQTRWLSRGREVHGAFDLQREGWLHVQSALPPPSPLSISSFLSRPSSAPRPLVLYLSYTRMTLQAG